MTAITNGFKARFKDIMDMNNQNSVPLYLAMLSHPTFKLNHIPELRLSSSASEYLHKCLGMLLKAIEIIKENEERENTNTPSNNAGENSEYTIRMFFALYVRYLKFEVFYFDF